MKNAILSCISPISVLVTVLVLLGSCTIYRVEYDRMTGTTYPPSQTVNGATVTLESIYAAEGYVLDVNEDTTNIAPLTGTGNCINEAELNTIETANRTTPVGPVSYSCGWWIFSGTCTDYHLYGVVVDHYYEYDSGNCGTGIMGIMWTDDRRAFANFYSNNTISTDGGKYLRSAAHEIGHAFNMHHGDGDGSTTIMNQTGTVGNNYVYVFSTESHDHLKDHPAECVRTGVGTFGSINTAHTDHGWTTVVCEVAAPPLGKECKFGRKCCEPAPDGSCYLCWPAENPCP